MRNNEAQRESRKKDKLDKELRAARADNDTKASEIKALASQLERYKQDITKTEQQLKEQRVGGICFVKAFHKMSILQIYLLFLLSLPLANKTKINYMECFSCNC